MFSYESITQKNKIARENQQQYHSHQIKYTTDIKELQGFFGVFFNANDTFLLIRYYRYLSRSGDVTSWQGDGAQTAGRGCRALPASLSHSPLML